MKFKYFYDESGIAPEEKINKWLEENPNIYIKSMYGDADRVYFLYDEVRTPRCTGELK